MVDYITYHYNEIAHVVHNKMPQQCLYEKFVSKNIARH